jgi:nucleoside-diphosphate-sugar epimerase
MPPIKRVLCTGGAGYIGSMLVPKLLSRDYAVNVLDKMFYGNGLAGIAHPELQVYRGDLRDPAMVRKAVNGCDVVIHLACISNDPCFELDPDWCRSIDYDAFLPLIRAAKAAGVSHFIYASSSSVYGVRGEKEVTEELALAPVTEYSKCKVMCEDALRARAESGFATTILRPATVCGWSTRLRLDVVVNALALSALATGTITVDGGDQYRANLHIEDMTDLYVRLLELPEESVNGKTWNIGASNLKVSDIAILVQMALGDTTEIVVRPVKDPRSYQVSSELIKRDIDFRARHFVAGAIRDLSDAFNEGKIPDAMTADRYYNIRCLKKIIADEKVAAA